MTPVEEEKTDWRVVIFGVCLGGLAAFQQFKLPPALPLLIARFGYSKTLAGSFMSVYALAGLVLSLPAGRYLGRKGPKHLITAALSCFIIGNAIGLALPDNGWLMLASRVFESVGFALLAIVGAVLATVYARPADRPIAVALWATWIPSGQIISTLVAIPSVSVGLWRPLWVATALATALLWYWGVKLGRGGAFRPGSEGPAGKGSPQQTIPADKKWLMFLASLMFGLWSGQYITYVTWLPQYLVETHGLDAGTAAKAYLVPSVIVIVFNLLTSRLLKARVNLALMLVVSTVAEALCWFLIPQTTSNLQGLLSLAVYGGMSGVTATAIFTLPGELLGQNAPRGFASMMTGRNLGVLIGPVLLAQLVTATGGWTLIPPIFGASCLLCAACGLRLGWRRT